MPFPFFRDFHSNSGWLSGIYAAEWYFDAVHSPAIRNHFTHPALAQVGQMARLQSIKCTFVYHGWCVLYPCLSLRFASIPFVLTVVVVVSVLLMPQLYSVRTAWKYHNLIACILHSKNFIAPHRNEFIICERVKETWFTQIHSIYVYARSCVYVCICVHSWFDA